ncbi:MAG: serine/threonine protein kinase [Sandaracinaceae bacterium]|nr:serine/threonine protein kinase [Sandaracinaceae bacterium]
MASPATAQTLARDLTGRRLGRYEVLTMLASGGMATVYVARAQGVAGFERLVAVKVLHPHLAHDEDFISMFLDEARLAARIRHPNAVGTLDISDTQGDGYFLVMEYVEGDHFGSLMRSAAKGGERLPVAVVTRIVMDALAGLNAAHRLTGANGEPLDLVHRDVSPHNILVGNDGVARITDFGVAKAQVRLSSTRDGQFKGKLSYMAPEQAAAGTADQRSDLFSMGIVLWEALTGRRLFRGENNADVLNKILNPEVPPPSTFDSALAPFDALAARALAREPDERFQTAEDFLEAIEDAAAPPRRRGHAAGRGARGQAVARRQDHTGARRHPRRDGRARPERAHAGRAPAADGGRLAAEPSAAEPGAAARRRRRHPRREALHGDAAPGAAPLQRRRDDRRRGGRRVPPRRRHRRVRDRRGEPEPTPAAAEPTPPPPSRRSPPSRPWPIRLRPSRWRRPSPRRRRPPRRARRRRARSPPLRGSSARDRRVAAPGRAAGAGGGNGNETGRGRRHPREPVQPLTGSSRWCRGARALVSSRLGDCGSARRDGPGARAPRRAPCPTASLSH